MSILVIDCANVVGSRPDGWWRDRPGAARRLAEALEAARLPYDAVILVLEGQARRGRTQVARQVASGAEVVVVTADREMRSSVEEAGGTNLGPSVLLDQL